MSLLDPVAPSLPTTYGPGSHALTYDFRAICAAGLPTVIDDRELTPETISKHPVKCFFIFHK